jgi:hypothetical protein
MKITKIHELVIVLTVTLLMASCKTMYRTNKVNAPVFKKKGELQAELVTGTGGIEVQGAYSLSNNLAILVSGVYDNSKVRVMDTLSGVKNGNSEYSNLFAEGALGYYKTFGIDTSKMIAVYIGGGIGETKGYSDLWQSDYLKYNSKYTRFFVQPTYGIFVKKNVEVAAALRLSFVNYHSLSINDDLRTSYLTNSYDLFVDPVITVKAGYEQFKFIAQLGASVPLMKQEYYSSSPFLFSVGFHLNFTRYWEKEDQFYDE